MQALAGTLPDSSSMSSVSAWPNPKLVSVASPLSSCSSGCRRERVQRHTPWLGVVANLPTSGIN